jgi:recombinational DNA repair ATPase RecF
MKLLHAINAQVFVTAITDVSLSEGFEGQLKRFHVKHGNVTEML